MTTGCIIYSFSKTTSTLRAPFLIKANPAVSRLNTGGNLNITVLLNVTFAKNSVSPSKKESPVKVAFSFTIKISVCIEEAIKLGVIISRPATTLSVNNSFAFKISILFSSIINLARISLLISSSEILFTSMPKKLVELTPL